MNRPRFGFLLHDNPVDLSAYRSVYVSVAGEEGALVVDVDGEPDTLHAGATVKLPDEAKIVTLRTKAPNNVTWGGIKKG